MTARPPVAARGGPRVAVVAALLLTATIVAACGIPTDHSPRALDPHALPAALAQATTTSTTTPPGRDTDGTIYLLQTTGNSKRLKEVPITVAYSADPAQQAKAVINGLIAYHPVPSGSSSTLTNSIPSTVHILDAKLDNQVLYLNVSNLDNVESGQQHVAFAQIVFTATKLPEILSVRFSIDGTSAQVPLRNGTSGSGEAVGPNDFQDLKPAP